MSIPVLLPWQHTVFQTSLVIKALQAVFGIMFDICQWYLICVIQQAFKFVRSSLWPCSMFFFFSLKSPKVMKSGWGEWKRMSCHWNQIFYSSRCFACRIISLPNCNGFCCRLTKIALFVYLMFNLVEWMMSSVLSFAYFAHFPNWNISGTNAEISKWLMAFSIFPRILCDKPLNSRVLNLIIVAFKAILIDYISFCNLNLFWPEICERNFELSQLISGVVDSP